MPDPLTHDAWLLALQQAGGTSEDDPNAITRGEWMTRYGVTKAIADRQLSLIVKSGLAERTTKRIRDAAGRPMRVPAYRLATPAASMTPDGKSELTLR